MRVSTSQYNSGTLNPYQEDKEQILANMDSITKAVNNKDFDSAKDILSQTEKLFDKKTSKRLLEQQTKLKEELQSLSEAITKHDPSSVKEFASKVQNEVKTNKNLVVKTHSATDLSTNLSMGMLNALYA